MSNYSYIIDALLGLYRIHMLVDIITSQDHVYAQTFSYWEWHTCQMIRNADIQNGYIAYTEGRPSFTLTPMD